MNIETVKTHEIGCIINGTIFVPNDPANTDYQLILDWINEGNLPEGPDVIEPDYVALRTGPDGYAPIHEQLAMQTDGTWDAHVTDVKTRFPKSNTGSTTIGDVPQAILDAAAAKLASKQLEDYTTATARLAQYVLSVGREEVIESKATGERVFNEETSEMEDVMADVVTVIAIDPLDATITQLVYSDDIDAEPTEETIENPLITQDNAERADAQAIVDATPQPVIDEYNS
jgi:hypothetical protein